MTELTLGAGDTVKHRRWLILAGVEWRRQKSGFWGNAENRTLDFQSQRWWWDKRQQMALSDRSVLNPATSIVLLCVYSVQRSGKSMNESVSFCSSLCLFSAGCIRVLSVWVINSVPCVPTWSPDRSTAGNWQNLWEEGLSGTKLGYWGLVLEGKWEHWSLLLLFPSSKELTEALAAPPLAQSEGPVNQELKSWATNETFLCLGWFNKTKTRHASV